MRLDEFRNKTAYIVASDGIFPDKIYFSIETALASKYKFLHFFCEEGDHLVSLFWDGDEYTDDF